MDYTISWLEAILYRNNFEESIKKVLNLETSAASKKGENYLSNINRIKATVLLGSGKKKHISVIVKNRLETEYMLKISLEMGIFCREITLYRDVLPKMEDLLDEVGDTDVPWGKCYDFRLYDRIVLEDLQALGFKMLNRKEQLGLGAAQIVLKQLGKFHALSRILLLKGEIPLDVYNAHIYDKMREFLVKAFVVDVQRLINLLLQWGEEWNDAMERFKNTSAEDLGKLYFDAMNADPKDFIVLNHGDCWCNNMMFKYLEDDEYPSAVKFIDWQIAFLGRPATDIHYFLITSVRQEILEQHYDRLLHTYCDSLKLNLLKFNYDGQIPNFEDIRESLRKTFILHLGESFRAVPVMLGDEEGRPDTEDMLKREFDAILKGEETPEDSNQLTNLSQRAENIIKSAIKRSIDLNII